jgi:hypothetical protein
LGKDDVVEVCPGWTGCEHESLVNGKHKIAWMRLPGLAEPKVKGYVVCHICAIQSPLINLIVRGASNTLTQIFAVSKGLYPTDSALKTLAARNDRV